MSECRACLVKNVRMRLIQDTRYQEMYEKLSGSQLSKEDGRPDKICYICNSQLQKFWSFFEMAKNSEELFSKRLIYGAEMFQVRNIHNMVKTPVKSMSFIDDGTDEPEVTVTVKEEPDSDEWEQFREEFMDSQDGMSNSPLPALEEIPEDIPTNIEITPPKTVDLREYQKFIKTEPIHPNEALPAAAKKLLQNLSKALNIPLNTNIKHELNINPLNANIKRANIRTTTNRENYICSVCNYRCRQAKTLRRHTKVHDQSNQYICKHCSYRFIDEKKLATHKNYCTVCHICSKKFHNRTSLKIHVRLHTGVQPYACDMCGRGFNQKTNLQTHLRVHSREKQYPCEICHKIFPFDSYLKRHMLIHSENNLDDDSLQQTVNCHKLYDRKKKRKQCICPECGKILRQDSLVMHMMLHTGERPFSCERCGRGFTQKCNMLTHIERVHAGDELFACKVCFKTFASNSELRRHCVTHTFKSELNENLEYLLSHGVKAEPLTDIDMKDIKRDLLTDNEDGKVDSDLNNDNELNKELVTGNGSNKKVVTDNKQNKELVTGNGSNKKVVTDNEQNKELATDNVENNELVTDNEQNKELATDNEENKDLTTDNAQNKELTTDNEENKELTTDNEENKELVTDNKLNTELITDNELNKELVIENEPNEESKIKTNERIEIEHDYKTKKTLEANSIGGIRLRKDLIATEGIDLSTDSKQNKTKEPKTIGGLRLRKDLLNEDTEFKSNLSRGIEINELKRIFGTRRKRKLNSSSTTIINNSERTIYDTNGVIACDLLTNTHGNLDNINNKAGKLSETNLLAANETNVLKSKFSIAVKNLQKIHKTNENYACDVNNFNRNTDLGDTENINLKRNSLSRTEGVVELNLNSTERNSNELKRELTDYEELESELPTENAEEFKREFPSDTESADLDDGMMNDGLEVIECDVVTDNEEYRELNYNDAETDLDDSFDTEIEVLECDVYTDTEDIDESGLNDTEGYNLRRDYTEFTSGMSVDNVIEVEECDVFTDAEVVQEFESNRLNTDSNERNFTETELQIKNEFLSDTEEQELEYNTLSENEETELHDNNTYTDTKLKRNSTHTERHIEVEFDTHTAHDSKSIFLGNSKETRHFFNNTEQIKRDLDAKSKEIVRNLFTGGNFEIKSETFETDGDDSELSQDFTYNDSITDTAESTDIEDLMFNTDSKLSARDFEIFQQKHIYNIHRKLNTGIQTPYPCDICKTRVFSY